MDTSFGLLDSSVNILDTSFGILDSSVNILDTSFGILDTSLNSKADLIYVDLSLNSKANISSPQFTGDSSFNARLDVCGNFYAQYPDNSIPASAIDGTLEYTPTTSEDLLLNAKLSVQGDVSLNTNGSGRVDVCGNFYAQYPANSIPASAIHGTVSDNHAISSADL